jgi:hypothetical protein
MKTITRSKVHRIKVHRIRARLQSLFSCLDNVQSAPNSIPSLVILSDRLILVVP